MIRALGIGPGDPELLTLRGQRLLEEAQVVAGFATVLGIVEGIGAARRIVLTYRDQEEKLAEIGRLHREGLACVVCFMGDPSFSGYELLARVEAACGTPVEIVPGVSSAQLAAARARIAFEDVVFVTFHKRGDIEGDRRFLAEALRLGRGAIVLPRPREFMPADIARDLLERGVTEDRRVVVFESLSTNERSWEGTLATLTGSFSDLSILVIRP